MKLSLMSLCSPKQAAQHPLFSSFASLLAVSFLLSITPIFAQNTSIGLKLGPNWANISNTNGQTATGFRLGAFLTHSIERDYGISAELNFARKGRLTNGEQRIALDYLEVPIMAYYFFGQGAFRPKVMVGPYVAYLWQATQASQEVNGYTAGDYGAVLGLGFHKSLGKSRWLNVDVRYTYGLAEVAGTNRSNRDLSLNLGLSFPLGNF